MSTPAEADYAAALAELPEMTTSALRRLLDVNSPGDAWAIVARGSVPDWAVTRRPAWTGAARSTDVSTVGSKYRRYGVGVAYWRGPGYPAFLYGADQPPAVLFVSGPAWHICTAPQARRVAVVGTRTSTSYGKRVASDLGRDLAAAGVCVVSGLASGIDSAAHRGALSVEGAPPVGVVASGLDAIYPRSSAAIWGAVAERGVLVSEYPLGTEPHRWHFPVRNRVIAALAHVLVVVESDLAGGAMHTVDAAAGRGIDVMAVPGPVTVPASRGTNALIHAGGLVARDAEDVLVQLSLSNHLISGDPAGPARQLSWPLPSVSARTIRDTEERSAQSVLSRVGEHERTVWGALGAEPTPTARIVEECPSLSVGEVAVALASLEGEGLVRSGTGWWERC